MDAVSIVVGSQVLLVVAVGAGFWVLYGLHRQNHTDLGPWGDVVRELQGAVLELKGASDTPPDILERVEVCERKVAELHSEAMKYFSRAAATENRIDRKRAEQGGEGEGMTQEQAQKLLDAEPEAGYSTGTRTLTLGEIESQGR